MVHRCKCQRRASPLGSRLRQLGLYIAMLLKGLVAELDVGMMPGRR